MNIKFKKLMSVLLCCVMLFGMLPVNAFANVTGEQNNIVLEENVQEGPGEMIPSSDEPVVEEPVLEEEGSDEEITEEDTLSEQDFSENYRIIKDVSEEDNSEEIIEENTVPGYLEQMKGYYDQAVAAGSDADNAVYAEIYNGAMAVYAAAGSPSAETDPELYNATGMVIMTLQGYGYDPYAVATTANVTVAQGSSVEYKGLTGKVDRTTKFTISPSQGNIQVVRVNDYSVNVTAGDNCEPGTYTVSYKRGTKTYTFTVEVTKSASGGDSGSDNETGEKVKVYVYVATTIPGTNDSWADNPEFCDLIGLYKADANKYFPVGEIYLDSSYLTGKNYTTIDSPLINNNEDWDKLLAALSVIDTTTLTGEFAVNNQNKVNQYLSQASKDLNQHFGSQRSALCRWNTRNTSYGFKDQTVQYHLDLLFNAKKITFVTGNNGIQTGSAKDGTVVDSRVYITGTAIQDSSATIDIPEGWRLAGYYSDRAMTNVWDGEEANEEGVGEPISKDSTVYIKIVPKDNVLLQYVVASGEGTVSRRDEALNPDTGVAQGSVAAAAENWTFEGWYSDRECTNKLSSNQNYVPAKPQGGWVDATYYAKFVPATADLTIRKVYTGLPEGLKPTVTVSVKDETGSVVGSVRLSADAPSGTVSGLKIGKSYTVVESADSAAVENYKLTTTYAPANGQVKISGGTNEVTVTNTYILATVDISGTKTWNDANNQDGMRPGSITINLLANGTKVDSKVVTGSGNIWSYTFENKAKYAEDGSLIQYTVKEEAVTGYDATVSGTDITNTHVPEKTSITIIKKWNDADNQDGKRPASITAVLYANGVQHSELTITAEESWTKTINDLPKYAAGKAIVYTVKEINVPDGYTANVNGLTITNSHRPEVVSVSGSKTWNDANNQAGFRPVSITINLLANGAKVASKVVTAADGWAWTFANVDKYYDGKEIVYTITEDKVVNYSSEVNGYNVTNTHVPELVDLTIQKIWNDAEDQDGIRPDSIRVDLLANGAMIRELVLSESEGWTVTVEDLPVYRNGQRISYTVEEIDVPGDYTSSVDGLTITNSYQPAVVSVSGTKTWNDNNDQDGIRPESITVNLLADDKKIQEVEVSAENNWQYTFNNLPKYRNGGVAINYTVTENEVKGYTTSYEGYNVINTHEVEKTSVSGSKTWLDADNQDGKRPASITITLWADGEFVASKVVAEADDWAWTFDNLDVNKNGEKITYTIAESDVDGYASKVDGFNVTNTHAVEKTNVSGTKTWDDAENQDGIRPTSITVNLLANGEKVASQTVNAKDEWKYSFSDLDKYEAGKEIVYTVTEEKVEGYTTTVEGYKIINTHIPETIEISVSKAWDDAENQDGIRPTSVTINLLANGTQVASKEVTAANGWTGTFKDLPKFENGKEIKYSVEESGVPKGYTASVDGFRIKNTHAPEKTSVSGTKSWNDNDNQDGIRPTSITVNLLANGEKVAFRTVDAKDEWKYSFSDLDKYEAGKEIVYTVTEEKVEGYTTTVEGYKIINTHIPETIEISVSKAWDDAENQDGIRPASVTVNLLANGTQVASKEVTAADGWAGTFENLPKFENGKEIKYSVEESGVPKGYTASVDGFQIKNTHAPAKTSVAVSKVWADAENQDGIRPASVTIELMASDKVVDSVVLNAENEWTHVFTDLDEKAAGQDIVYTVRETEVPTGYTAAVTGDMAEGYVVTNTHEVAKTSVAVSKSWDDANNQDGKRPAAVTIRLLANGETTDISLSLNEENEWTDVFSDLDKFANGEEIVYTVSEDAVADYNTDNENGLPVITGNASAGYTVTNTHVPETVAVSGQKTWVDADNQDGKRPTSITINLLADGEKIASKTVKEADGWKWNFENLPKYKAGAVKQEVAYTITEDSITDYSASINGYDVTNTHTPAKTSVTVTKVWKDEGNQDGIRPNDVTITLLADGVDTGKTLILNSGNWTGSFTGLDVYKAGKEIVYTVQEQAVPGYTTQITGTAADGYVVANTHTPAVIAVEGSKIWDDANDHDGFRPDAITINLLADGEKIASKTVKETDGWKWSFKDLPKYKVGAVKQEVVYAISEDKVERYTTEIDGYDVTNSYTPQKTAVAVNKVWLDENDQDGIRPNHITVKLLADGVATEKTLVLSVGNNWNGSFTDLDKYKDGKEIVYTVEEVKVDGYTSAIGDNAAGGYTITNTHTPAVVTVSGAKTWEDHKNQDGKRPESITIRLLADGKEIKVIEVNEAAEWKWTFENLPKFAAGKEIVYTITEDAVEGYIADVKDFNVTNTHNPAKTTVTVTKVWEDSNNQDGLRPESVTINLLANGEKVKSHKIKEDDKWTYTFEKLDKFEDGKEIVYTVTEEAVEGYNTVITGDAGKGFTVTNSHTPEVMDIAGTKTWDDGNNQDGKRPDAITVNLLANGKVIDTVKVTSAEKWTYLFTNLPKFEAGEEIIYTVTEDAVEDYTTTYDGYNIINKYTPKKTSITVTKRWVDGHNHDGIRPNSVKVILYANGKPVDTMRLSEKHNWTGVFKNLPVYQNGEPIKYTLQEKSVSGYNATITGNARKGFIVTNTHNIIPKTGDESNLPLYTGLFGAGFSAMAVLLFLAKPRKKGKYAR